ncbi:MAG: type I 3-dehydroquinate dehydratase [Phycisphaerae bacterium]|nr:type I 3-dehydroquinate dehydratase [Phycisphaerae bacterium]
MTRIIVPIVDLHAPLKAQAFTAYAADADLVELRADLIGDPDAIADYLAIPDRPPCILTIRSAAEGGAWEGSESERISLIERLGLLNPGFIDVELSTWRASANIRQKIGLVCQRLRGGEPENATTRAKNQLILSVHDFQGMSAWDRDWDELRGSPAHMLKMAVTPADSCDALRILARYRAARESGEARGLMLIGMGEAGAATRVLGKCCYAWGTYAPIDASRTSAPGQIDLRALWLSHRWGSLWRGTKIYGVIGWPVAHSRSPEVHNSLMKERGIDGVYVRFPVAPDYASFAAFMDQAAHGQHLPTFAGFSVTIPHKEHALRWLVERGGVVSPRAARIGAVNTLAAARLARGAGDVTGSAELRPDAWLGENTDYDGVVAMLHAAVGDESGVRGLRGEAAAILGAGGAARAAIAALQELGLRCTIYNRTPERARALAADFPHATAAAWDQRLRHGCRVIVNCTSVGMHPEIDASPLPASAIAPAKIVLETIYTPRETRLVRDAIAAGCRVGVGEVIFAAQAAAQARLWHGQSNIA